MPTFDNPGVTAKLFEVRDRATFIIVMAVLLDSEDGIEEYLLNRSGNAGRVVVTVISGGHATSHFNKEGWGDRTMTTAHEWIQRHFEELTAGDVIDVEHVLGETRVPKRSELYDRFTKK